MSDSPLLSKMDALMKKHRGGSESGVGISPEHIVSPEAAPAPEPACHTEHTPLSVQMPPPGAWLPVLTDVIERGSPPAMFAAAPVAIATPSEEARRPDAIEADLVPAAAESDVLAEQLMNELAPRLSEVMEKQVAAELRKNLDQTIATLLSQLDVNVREIVREAVAEKLRQPRDPSR